jgi:hypothetical protein
MAYTEDFGTNDATNIRKTPYGTNNAICAERRDPYGLWHLSLERGPISRELTGAFTSYEEAQKAIQAFLSKKNSKE